MQEKELLDVLKDCLGLNYISDLLAFLDYRKISAVVDSIPSDRYSISEWNDAVRYLTGYEGVFCVPENAKQFLITYG